MCNCNLYMIQTVKDPKTIKCKHAKNYFLDPWGSRQLNWIELDYIRHCVIQKSIFCHYLFILMLLQTCI